MEVYTFKVHRQAPRRRVDWEDCGLYKVNFQSPSDFREYTLFCVYIETAWYRESLQHRKAFVKLLPVFSPTLLQFCLSLYSHPLILTFTTHNSRCGPWGYHVPLQSSGGCVGSPTSFFFSDVFLHSGVTLFHSPTQGITSPRGAAVDLVGRCAFHSTSDMTRGGREFPKLTGRDTTCASRRSYSCASDLKCQRFTDIAWGGRKWPAWGSGLER